jgi:hypothetical protein
MQPTDSPARSVYSRQTKAIAQACIQRNIPRQQPQQNNRIAREEDDSTWSPVSIAVAISGAIPIAVVCASGGSPWGVAPMIVLWLLAAALINPRTCIALTLVFLALQGDVRRIVSVGVGQGSDPLVLVPPAIVIVLTIMALAQNRLSRKSPLSRNVLIVLLIMAIQALNPMQGGVLVGLTGVLCVMVPMCWFWVGQAWATPRFLDTILFRLIVPLAVAAGVFGVVQVFGGRPDYQEQWMERLYQNVPHSYDRSRPFGFFTSVGEFTKFLSIGLVLLISSAMAGRIRLLIVALPFIALSLFFASARGPIVTCSGVIIFAWALCSKSKTGGVVRVVLASACIIGGLIWTLSEVSDIELSPDLQYLVKHQTDGLLNPLDERKSTATGHWYSALGGVGQAMGNPIGRGLGCATHIAGAYGGSVAGTEIDISNMFVCLGLIGGIAYTLLYYRVFTTAIAFWRQSRAPIGLCAIAVLLAVAGNWLNTGEYSSVSIVWFCIGAVDRLSSDWKQKQVDSLPRMGMAAA